MRIGKKQIPALVVTLIAVVGVVAAANIMNTTSIQSGPKIGDGSASQNCGTLTSSQTQALPGNYNPSVAILFDCSTYGFAGTAYPASGCIANNAGCPQTPAFTIGATGQYTPMVQQGSYVKVFYYAAVTTYPFPGPFSGANCGDTTWTIKQIYPPLVAGPITVAAGEYNYCAEFANVPTGGLTGFTVTWNTP